MPTIRVEIPSRNQTIEFDQGTPESVIQDVIKRDFPRNGQDVAYEVNQMPGFSKTISDEDFSLYEKFVDQKKTDLLQTALGAAGGIVETVGKGIKGLFEIRNLSPEVAASTALESGLQGTRDLYGMVAQSEDPSSFFFKFKDLLDGTSSVAERKKQWLEARDFVEQTQKYEAGKETVSGLDPALVNNDVKNTLKLIADPTLFIPGVGELVGAGKFGTRATGLAMKGTGAAATAVTKPLSEFIGGVGRMAGEAIGADAGKLRNVAAGAGVTGFAMGIPGVSEAAAVVGAIEGANKAGQVLERAGGQLMNAPTRIGALESLALNPNASSFDRAIAKVGRYGGDDIIDMGSRALAGGVEGAAIGTVLGGLAGGEEGAAAGFGSGGVLGAGGAGIARVVDKASGKAAVEARHNDFNRFYENLDKDTQSKFDTVVKNSGIDGAAQVMDISGIIRGKFNDADVRFSTADEFATKYGQDARGVQIVEGERPVVDINVDKFNSQATVGHELFHAFKAIDQLRPLVERAEQMIVGNYVIDGNGQSVRTTPGLLDDAAILKTFDDYVSKLKPDENSKWAKANTLVEKSKLIGEELGAEYMSRLIQGSDTDAMLRGFDGLTRTILDKALLSNTEGFLRRTAQSLGLGSKPIESLVFTKLEQASPALNAALRDMVRARRNMNKKIELAEDTGFAIRNRDLANPAAAKIATDMGIAETGVDGVTRMKPDDVLAQEDRASSDALTAAIKSAPVVDVNEPRLREVDGQLVGDGISNAQLAAIQASPNIIDKVKKGIAILKNSIESGNVIFIRNGKATKEIKSRLTGKTLKRYNDGVRITERDIVPYALATSQAGELFVRTFDISKARNEAMSLASRDRLGPYKADFQTFYGDLARYLNNLSDRENAVPTKELFGDAAKAAYMTDFFGGKNDTAAKYIRNFTLDRMIDMRPTGEKVSMSQIAYDRNKARFMPAENLGDSKVFNSPDSGYRIISKNNKHSLYAPTGERIGIYDTQAKAESVSSKIQNKSTQISVSQPKVADGIVTAPESGAFKFTKDVAANFMPADSKVRLDNYADRTIIALAADRMGVGQAEVGPLSNRKILSVPTQGGREFMKIFNGGGWAFSDIKTGDRFLSRLRQFADKNGNTIVGITVLNEINHLNNPVGQLAYVETLQAAIEGGAVSKSQADAHIKEISKRIQDSKASSKSLPQSTRDLFSNINDLDSLVNAVKNREINFKSAAWLVNKAQAKTLPISYDEASSKGMSVEQIARGLTDKELLDIPNYSVVALMEVNVNQKPDLNNFHHAYPVTVHGKTIGFLDKFYNLADLSTEPKIRNKAGAVTAQPVQNVMPVMDNIRNTLKTQQGIPSDPAQRVNFMPGQAPSPAVKVLEELKRSNFVSDKIAKAALGSFPDYLKPVADFITEQRDKLVNGKLTPRDIAKAYMVTVASQGTGAIFVKTIADKLAPKGIAFEPSALFRTEDGKKIRPEEAASWWLGTENGKRALDNIEKGIVNPADWVELGEVRRAYGDDRFKTFRALNPENLANISKVTRELNASNGNSSRVLMAVQALNGISTGKKGFISHLLGLGDTPTIDAVEINFWLTGQGDIKALNTKKAELARKIKDAQSDRRVSGELFRRIDERIAALRGDVPGSDQVDPQVWAHILHHWLWDKAKGIQTTHAGMYEAQRNFQPAAPDTPAFKEWFRRSAVKDENGTPTVVYHGTPTAWGLGNFTEFDSQAARKKFNRPLGMDQVGSWFSSKPGRDGAEKYAGSSAESQPVIYPVFLSIQRPFMLSFPEFLELGQKVGGWKKGDPKGRFDGVKVREYLQERGYDGILFDENDIDGGNHDVWVAFEPTQIKSATGNRGTFDATNPDIRFMPAEKLPNGQAWSTDNNYRVIQKEGGKYRVYAPTGTLIGVADTLDKSKKLIEKRSR